MIMCKCNCMHKCMPSNHWYYVGLKMLMASLSLLLIVILTVASGATPLYCSDV